MTTDTSVQRFGNSCVLPPSSRGGIVALIGPDGSGKTTVGRALLELLRREGRAAEMLHLGTPSGSKFSRAIRLGALAVRKTMRLLSRDRATPDPSKYFRTQVVLDLALAFEREAAVHECLALAADGVIVITDRFPGKVPGSASGPSATSARSLFVRTIQRLEQLVYAKLPEPTCAIRLRVPLELSLKRNAARRLPKPAGIIASSHDAAARLRFVHAPEIEIDATDELNLVVQKALAFLYGFVGQRARQLSE